MLVGAAGDFILSATFITRLTDAVGGAVVTERSRNAGAGNGGMRKVNGQQDKWQAADFRRPKVVLPGRPKAWFLRCHINHGQNICPSCCLNANFS
jgi:hypothetical protein